MIIQLSNFASYFADLPPLQTVFRVQDQTMLLLKLPQLGVHVERAPEIGLPLAVAVLGQVSAVEERKEETIRT